MVQLERGPRGADRAALECRDIGGALLVHPEGEIDPRVHAFVGGLAKDPEHTLVVVDLPEDPPAEDWESVAKLLRRRGRSFRVIIGRPSRETAMRVGQLLADRLDRTVLTPDGRVLPAAGGVLFVPEDAGCGWLGFQPHRPSAWARLAPHKRLPKVSRRFPVPDWDCALPARSVATSAGGTAEPLPAGVWIRRTDQPESERDAHRSQLSALLLCQSDQLTVVLGCPGGPDLSVVDIERFWGCVAPDTRPQLRFAPYGPVGVPEGGALGQFLADRFGQEITVYAGLPTAGEPGTHGPRMHVPGKDGTPGPPAFVREMVYRPSGATGFAAPPTLRGSRPPLDGLPEISTGVYQYAPDAVLEVTQSGLRLRPQAAPADSTAVHRVPADPSGPAIHFDAGTPESEQRMRSLAEEVRQKLDPGLAETCRVLTAPKQVVGPASSPAGVAGEQANADGASVHGHVPAAPGYGTGPAALTGGAPVSQPGTVPAVWEPGPQFGAGSAGLVPGVPVGEAGTAAAGSGPGVGAGSAGLVPGVPVGKAGPAAAAAGSGPELGAGSTGLVSGVPVGEPGPAAAAAAAAAVSGLGLGTGAAAGLVPGASEPTPVPAVGEPAPAAGAAEPGPVPAASTGSTPAGPATPDAPAAQAPQSIPAPPMRPRSLRLESAPPSEAGPADAADVPSAGADTVGPEPVAQPAPRTSPPPAPPPAPTSSPVPPPAAAPAAPAPPAPGASGTPAPAPAPTPPARPKAQRPAVRVQPVPSAEACAALPDRGVEQERAWLRRTFQQQYDAASNHVARVLSESPGLRGGSRQSADDVVTDLVAVRMYLSGGTDRLDSTVRSATVGPHVPLARCVASGLRRLPSYRGATMLRTTLSEAEWQWYGKRRLVTEWAFCSALTTAHPDLPGDVDVLIWSMTARRTALLDPTVPDRVLYLPGTSFKVLGLRDAERRVLLLRELTGPEIGADGNVDLRRLPLDDLAVTRLEQADTEWRDAKPAARLPATAVSALRHPPGLILTGRSTAPRGADTAPPAPPTKGTTP